MQPKGVGILLAHYTLWQHLAMIGSDGIVFEDDAMLVSNFKSKVSKALAAAPPFDLLYLGSTDTHKRQSHRTGGVPGYGWYNHIYGTHCYYVKQSALSVLLSTMAIAESPVDLQLYDRALPHLKYYVCEPSLAGQWTWGPD
jgi:GR25 family glycosyltransferase involved in LPS biosynthesis